MISLKDFKNYKRVLENSITNKAFRSRLLFEAIFDEEFAKSILNYMDSLYSEINSAELDCIFNSIREETITYYNLSRNESDFNKKVSLAFKSLAYFYFLECMDEYSSLSNDIVEKIKSKYSNNYLDIVSRIDKANLSVDTRDKISYQGINANADEDILKKYIVLKQWQDKQHHFFGEEYGSYLEELQYQYYGDRSLESFDLEQYALRKKLFDDLRSRKILDLDSCSILSELYIKKYVINFIGGKMYGLSVLNSNGIKVPFTMVIPTDVMITNDDLVIFKNKFDRYSVRSSADVEDGEKNSFAGMFDSYLNVIPEKILENINLVKQSVHNKRLREYIKANGLENPHMAVVIQSFKEPAYAGVWVGNSSTDGILEWVAGNGEKLVSGSTTPHSEIWKDSTCANPLHINDRFVGESMLEYQEKIGCNADFEWMILDGELIMLQYRPVTKKITASTEYKAGDEGSIQGIPASPGLVEGDSRFLESPNQVVIKDRILLARMTDPDWLPHLINSKGAVTAYGGFLCHTAIVCRELGIPCVTGIGEEALEKLTQQDNSDLEVDGTSGVVKALRR